MQVSIFPTTPNRFDGDNVMFFLTNHLQAVVDLFMFHGHVVEVNKPESSFMRGVHT